MYLGKQQLTPKYYVSLTRDNWPHCPLCTNPIHCEILDRIVSRNVNKSKSIDPEEVANKYDELITKNSNGYFECELRCTNCTWYNSGGCELNEVEVDSECCKCSKSELHEVISIRLSEHIDYEQYIIELQNDIVMLKKKLNMYRELYNMSGSTGGSFHVSQ